MTHLHHIERPFLVLCAFIQLAGDALLAAIFTAPASPQPALVQPLAPAPSPAIAVAPPPLEGLKVTELRSIARARLGSSARIAGRRIAQARRADLLLALA